MQHEQRQHAEQRVVVQPGRADAADEADEGADRQVEIVDGDDEHLRDGGERDRHRRLQHQVEPEIAHGARLHDRRWRSAPRPARGRAGRARSSLRLMHAGSVSAKEACSTFSSVSSSRARLGDDGAVAEHIGVVAVGQLVDLGRVPEEGAALRPPRRGSCRRLPAWCRRRRRASDRPSG